MLPGVRQRIVQRLFSVRRHRLEASRMRQRIKAITRVIRKKEVRRRHLSQVSRRQGDGRYRRSSDRSWPRYSRNLALTNRGGRERPPHAWEPGLSECLTLCIRREAFRKHQQRSRGSRVGRHRGRLAPLRAPRPPASASPVAARVTLDRGLHERDTALKPWSAKAPMFEKSRFSK